MKAAKKVALEAEKDNDAAQKEVQELQRVMEPKRARTNSTTPNDHEECDEQSSGDMDIADYRREAARIQKRRSVALGSREDVPTQESPCCRLRNKSHRAAEVYQCFLFSEVFLICECLLDQEEPQETLFWKHEIRDTHNFKFTSYYVCDRFYCRGRKSILL